MCHYLRRWGRGQLRGGQPVPQPRRQNSFPHDWLVLRRVRHPFPHCASASVLTRSRLSSTENHGESLITFNHDHFYINILYIYRSYFAIIFCIRYAVNHSVNEVKGKSTLRFHGNLFENGVAFSTFLCEIPCINKNCNALVFIY